MDRSLDEVIVDRQRAGARNERRGGSSRLNEGPRDGIRKAPLQPRSREPRSDLDKDWVHDRFEGDRYSRPSRNERYTSERSGIDRTSEGTRIRVENLHYELTERDITELFTRIAPISSLNLLFDRSDRSRGIAYVTYSDPRDATAAIREFDGANAYGQPIHLTQVPSALGPSRNSRADTFDRGAGLDRGGGRSLFDRINAPRRARSVSPDRRVRATTPEGVDRYVPGRRSEEYSPGRSRRGGRGIRDNRSARDGRFMRDEGRRPGERRGNEGTRGGRGRRGRDGEGRPVVQGRPRKTAEELDEEMMDYFKEGEGLSDESVEQSNASAPTGGVAAVDEDVDMIQ